MSCLGGDRKSTIQSLDCLCSAVLCNCCQFSCCFLDVPLIEYQPRHCHNKNGTEPDETASHGNWMRCLMESHPDIKLRDMVIPGTHDSGSYALHWLQFFSAVGRTQNFSVLEQLYSGARYLDVRVAGSGDDAQALSVWHGCLKCCPFSDVLTQIATFLDDNPNEFLFLDIVPEYGKDFTNDQKLYTLQLLQEVLGEKCINGAEISRSKLMDELTLSEIVNDQKKQIILMLHPRFFKNDFVIEAETKADNGEEEDEKEKSKDDDSPSPADIVETKYGFVSSGSWMRSKWHNTKDKAQLLEWNLEEVQKYGSRSADNQRNRGGKILNNQFVLTPGLGGPSDVMSLLVGLVSLRVISLAAKLYEKDALDTFFRSTAKEKWNLVMLDFIDITPSVMSFLINLNFPNEMQILFAAVKPSGSEEKPIDVTEQVRTKIVQNKVLYLIDVPKDLELNSEGGNDCGTITVVYKLVNPSDESASSSSKVSVLSAGFHSETELIIGQFSHNADAAVIQFDTTTIPEEDQASGYISSDGRIAGASNTEAAEELKQQPICLQYNLIEGEETQNYAFQVA